MVLIIVICSILVTSATHGRIYRGGRHSIGSKSSAYTLMCSSHSAVVSWPVSLAFLATPTLGWIMPSSISTTELTRVCHGLSARRPGPDGRTAPSLEELILRNESSPVNHKYIA
ncbi:Myelin proteolipid [Fasciola hepatica]|uniref:Myelin proteolipid n=1 Tax=Fasciola hepatica TaxID=6192 RepID=A0A2H1CXY6_FASHE|nr:Myelin proteolipid [Fasciola hepatica]